MKYAVIPPRTPSPFPYCISIVYPSSIHRLSLFGIPLAYLTGVPRPRGMCIRYPTGEKLEISENQIWGETWLFIE